MSRVGQGGGDVPDSTQGIGIPLKTFVEETVKQVVDALPRDFRIVDDIKFDLSIVSAGEGKGGIDAIVVKFGGTVSQEQTQRVTFAVTNKPLRSVYFESG